MNKLFFYISQWHALNHLEFLKLYLQFSKNVNIFAGKILTTSKFIRELMQNWILSNIVKQ